MATTVYFSTNVINLTSHMDTLSVCGVFLVRNNQEYLYPLDKDKVILFMQLVINTKVLRDEL